jgi:hypothetical protein
MSKTKATTLVHWEWDEYVTACNVPQFKHNPSNDSWAGGSHEEAIDRATGRGYDEALPEAEDIMGRVEALVAADVLATTFQSRWDVSGAEVDLGRFVAGEPECMIESEPIKIARSGRAVRIAIPTCYSSFVPEELVRRRGAAVMALCDILARAQHPIEVWAGSCFDAQNDEGQHKRTADLVLVQHANQAFDRAKVMYAIAHPTMLRQLEFALEASRGAAYRRAYRIDKYGDHYEGGYGCGFYGINPEELPDQPGETIILPLLSGHEDWSEAASVRWIEEQLARIFAE